MRCTACSRELERHEWPGPIRRIADSEWPERRKNESLDDFARRQRRWSAQLERGPGFCADCLRRNQYALHPVRSS